MPRSFDMAADYDGGVEQVAIAAPVAEGTSIRRAGSDIAAGDTALTAGTVLHASQVGLLAALGVSMANCLLVVTLAPAVPVLGYELRGYRHAAAAAAAVAPTPSS